MAWLYTVLNPTKAAGGVWWIWYIWLHALFTGLYTVEYWIQQKQPVEFDGFGTHGYMLYSLGYTVEYWIQQGTPIVRHWWNWYSSKCKASMAWLYTVLNPTKAAGGVWWIWYIWLHALFTGLYTVEYWIQQKQPVEFDGFGTHGYMLYSLDYTLWSTESNKSSRWSLMDLVHMATCSIHWAIHCGVLNPTKAAGGVWWIWYTWLHALFTGLYCGVLNPTKAAGGVWWIWYTWLHALFTGLYTVEYWIQQKQPVEFDGFGTHGYMLYSLGYILWSTESNKSSRWSLMDLVDMATCSIRWAILWSAESIQNQAVEFDGFGTHGYMLYSLGWYCGVLNPTKAACGS